MPDSFQSIELRRVSGEIVDFDVSSMGGKPTPYLPVLVIRCIVLNQIDFLGEVTSDQLLLVNDIGRCVEDLLKMVKEAAGIEFDRAKNFQRFPLPGGGNFGLASYPRPGLVESGVLTESGFVLEEDGGSFASGFFLMSGYRYRTHRDWSCLSARARTFLGRWTENPNC